MNGRLISYHLTTGAPVRPPGIEPGTSAVVTCRPSSLKIPTLSLIYILVHNKLYTTVHTLHVVQYIPNILSHTPFLWPSTQPAAPKQAFSTCCSCNCRYIVISLEICQS